MRATRAFYGTWPAVAPTQQLVPEKGSTAMGKKLVATSLDLTARLMMWLINGTRPPPRDDDPGDGVEVYPEVVDMTAVIAILVFTGYGWKLHAGLLTLGLVARWVLRRTAGAPGRSRGNAAG